MSISPLSPKRLADIKSGKVKVRGTIKIDMEKIRAKDALRDKAIREELYGKPATTKRPKVKEEITYPQAEKMCDAAFSQWVRLKSADANGIVRCFICRIPMRWNRSVLMHFQSRTCIATQWDEVGCQPGCRQCNGKPNGDRAAFALRLDAAYGPGTAEALTIKSKRPEKPTTNDLLTKARWYRERIELIKTNDPGKFIK